jgi:hypothetical protein
MMPGATNTVVDNQAVDQRSAIVRTGGGDGKYLCSTTHEKHGVAVFVTNQLASIGKVVECYSEGEIGSLRI